MVGHHTYLTLASQLTDQMVTPEGERGSPTPQSGPGRERLNNSPLRIGLMKQPHLRLKDTAGFRNGILTSTYGSAQSTSASGTIYAAVS